MNGERVRAHLVYRRFVFSAVNVAGWLPGPFTDSAWRMLTLIFYPHSLPLLALLHHQAGVQPVSDLPEPDRGLPRAGRPRPGGGQSLSIQR